MVGIETQFIRRSNSYPSSFSSFNVLLPPLLLLFLRYCPRNGLEEAEAISPGSYGGGGTNLTRTLALPCEAGYFCAGGERKKCGSVALYCTAKASSSTAVSAGHFSTPLTGSPDERTGEAECEDGFYCRGGEKIKCPGKWFIFYNGFKI